jgi:hypothetical protein
VAEHEQTCAGKARAAPPAAGRPARAPAPRSVAKVCPRTGSVTFEDNPSAQPPGRDLDLGPFGRFPPDTAVVATTGLKGTPELDGRRGAVQEYSPEAGRCTVEPEGGTGRKSTKEANLSLA